MRGNPWTFASRMTLLTMNVFIVCWWRLNKPKASSNRALHLQWCQYSRVPESIFIPTLCVLWYECVGWIVHWQWHVQCTQGSNVRGRQLRLGTPVAPSSAPDTSPLSAWRLDSDGHGQGCQHWHLVTGHHPVSSVKWGAWVGWGETDTDTNPHAPYRDVYQVLNVGFVKIKFSCKLWTRDATCYLRRGEGVRWGSYILHCVVCTFTLKVCMSVCRGGSIKIA